MFMYAGTYYISIVKIKHAFNVFLYNHPVSLYRMIINQNEPINISRLNNLFDIQKN